VATQLPLPGALRRLISDELRANQEFQSGLVRVALWAFMVLFIGAAGMRGYYRVDWWQYGVLFAIHLLWYLAILASVLRRPEPSAKRRFLGMLGDLSGTTFAIYLGGEPLTPFYLLYIWIFVSQGARYGKQALKTASIGSLVAYSLVVTLLSGWERHGMETLFLMLVLVVLPIYEYSLLRRLHDARQAAESANRARGDFLATMTHELRTPLSGVVGMARLLGSTRLDSEQREYVASLSASANMLQSLIGDILDLSKIDARKLELKPEPFDVRRSVVEVATALTDQALDQGIELIVDVAGNVPVEVYGDPLRFRQVLFNLVGNAVKFTEQGHVLVQVKVGKPRPDLGKPHLYVVVKDTGIGIPRNKLDRIFESFWQADGSASRKYGGTGLGTTIARDLVRLMKGSIGVESMEGHGSSFWVCLPFLGSRHASNGRPSPRSTLRDRTALLLETNPQQLAIMERACRKAGMRYLSVNAVDKLGRALQEHAMTLDVVVLADELRGLDLEGLAELVEKYRGEPLPTVFIHYTRRQVAALAANAVALAKPFVIPDLWEALAQAMASQRSTFAEHSSLLNVAPEGHGAKVLVAEDDSINAKLMVSLLRKAGHQVVSVRDGQKALQAAVSQPFDLALVDLRMPHMDGLEFTRRYRAQEHGRRLPIVALTANAAEDARSECLAAGMDEFLTKPVDPELLDALLRRFRRHPQA
jgi:two-component system sensor histidine kinase RpfC